MKLIFIGCMVITSFLCYSQQSFLDPTFSGGRVNTKFSSEEDSASSVVIQTDGKIVVAGVIDGSYKNKLGIVRYLVDGNIDVSFGLNGRVIDSFSTPSVYYRGYFKMILQSDGKILVTGSRKVSANGIELILVRYNTNGSRDNTFGSSGILQLGTFSASFDNNVRVALQSSGNILCVMHGIIYRYTPTGVLDLSFGTSGQVITGYTLSANVLPSNILVQSDDKIVISVATSFWNGITEIDTTFISRYNSDGSIDMGYGSGGTVIVIDSVVSEYPPLLQSDGKLLVYSGIKGFYSSQPSFQLTRLLNTGTLDVSYGVSGKKNIVLNSVPPYYAEPFLQSDDKLILKSAPDSYHSTLITRYNNNGTLDSLFGVLGSITVPNILTTRLSQQTDGKIVVVGADYSIGLAYPFSIFRINSLLDTTVVWPGDANHNRIADNIDLLPIGLSYGATGTTRLDQGIDWEPKISTNWGFGSPMVYDVKHTDCNGDGTINADDALAILQNFGQTYSKKNDQPAVWRTGIAGLNVVLSKDTVRAGDTLVASIQLGDASLPVSNIYGIAFTYNYDALVVDTAQTEVIYPSSWLATSTTDRISISKDLKAIGQIKMAITRIDHNNRSGDGEIAQVKFKITTDNISGKNLAYYNNINFISAITAIDSVGNLIDLNAGLDSSLVEFTPNGVKTIDKFQVAIYPNPASGKLFVKTDGTVLERVTLRNLLGETIVSEVATGSNKTIDVSGLANGVYIFHLETNKGELYRRVVVSK